MVQENPELAEGTIRVKQEGRAGKKIELVRIFTVENQEISREVLSTKLEESVFMSAAAKVVCGKMIARKFSDRA